MHLLRLLILSLLPKHSILRNVPLLAPHSPHETIINILALVLDHQGKYEGAEQMQRQTLGLREKVLGEKHSIYGPT